MSLIFDYINTLVFEDMVDFDYLLDILGRIVEVNHWKVCTVAVDRFDTFVTRLACWKTHHSAAVV